MENKDHSALQSDWIVQGYKSREKQEDIHVENQRMMAYVQL